MSLAIAMTTTHRQPSTIDRALMTLRSAGFDETVHVFAEPETELAGLSTDRVRVHVNKRRRGCFGNWKKSLKWLVKHTSASWLLVLQDDAIWLPGSAVRLRSQMDVCRDRRTGLLSPYASCMVVKEGYMEGANTDGWKECRAGWDFWGALAFCLKRDAAKELLQHCRFAKHAGMQQVDAVVAASMLELDRPSFVHLPSLVDHIGVTSTIGNGDSEWGRRGYRFGERQS
jgi:hypothetical protein